jgi:hypothetical protein
MDSNFNKIICFFIKQKSLSFVYSLIKFTQCACCVPFSFFVEKGTQHKIKEKGTQHVLWVIHQIVIPVESNASIYSRGFK